MRTLPVSAIAGPLPRAIRDMAQAAGKQVEFTVTGGETELDRAILESLAEPLTHLLRNAVSHGIEPPDERRRAGKAACGRLELRAVPRGSLVEISVSDDGRGIAAGTAEEAEREGSLTEVLARPGYSTAAEVTDLAGRGVGLDAVQCYARSVGGTLAVHSQPGQGLEATLVLPLALAQLEVLWSAAGQTCTASRSRRWTKWTWSPRRSRCRAGRCWRCAAAQCRWPTSRRCSAWPARRADHPAAFIVSAGGRRVAIQRDRLIGVEEVVVKPLGPLAQADGCLGATIMGDGRVALLIEPGLFARRAGRRAVAVPSAGTPRACCWGAVGCRHASGQDPGRRGFLHGAGTAALHLRGGRATGGHRRGRPRRAGRAAAGPGDRPGGQRSRHARAGRAGADPRGPRPQPVHAASDHRHRAGHRAGPAAGHRRRGQRVHGQSPVRPARAAGHRGPVVRP